MTAIVYKQVTHHEFISFDDNIYVTENLHIREGLTVEGLAWSFNFDKRGTYWHPVTWLSHMLDCQLFGLDAGMHHLTNLILHCLNVLLLFAVLFRMTGALWRSAFVATLFAVHPINVDSVAWISERKNILSTFLWLSTMLAYTWYALYPSISRYSITLAIFVLGLLAKPMLVTLPFVFLLLDWWPLARLSIGGVKWAAVGMPRFVKSDVTRLISEKLPFLLFSFLSVTISSASLKANETIISFSRVPLDLRIANAVVSYVKYIGKLILPRNLAIYYPFPHDMLPFWQLAGSAVLLVFISAIALYYWKYHSWFITGWCWYLGTLVPVIGIIQGGLWPAMADRWAYVPFIGLYLIISWGFFALFEKWNYRTIVIIAGAAVIIVTLATLTKTQVEHWKNDFTLYHHAINVTKDNHMAHYNLAKSYENEGNIDEAINHYMESIRIYPRFSSACVNLGAILENKGRLEEAKILYRKVLVLNRSDVDLHNNLGSVLYKMGRVDEAVMHYAEAIRIDSSYLKSYNNMGIALFSQGRYDKAIEYFRKALNIEPGSDTVRENLERAVKLRDAISQSKPIAEMKNELENDPGNAEIHIKLGDLYLQTGAVANARQHYAAALTLNPGIARELQRRAIASVAERNYDIAVTYLQRLAQFTPNNIDVYYNVACVYALDGKNEAALHWLEKAIEKGFRNRALLATDDDFANIRDSEPFKNLVNSIEE